MKKITLFLSIVFGLTTIESKAQWAETGNLKNVTWEYSFTGSGTVTSEGKGLEKTSTPAQQDFLPKPPSGEVKIITNEETGQGKSSFALNANGANSGLTLGHSSGKGLAPAAAKFVAKDFAAKSKVMSVHFTLTPNSTAENNQAIWYFVVGASKNSSITGKGAPPITGYTTSDNSIYTLFRLRKTKAGGPYGLQVRYNSGDEKKWGWQSVPASLLTNGKEAKIDLFFNNSDKPQSYTFNGETKNLPAEAYHVYINNEQKGATLQSMARNYSPQDKSIGYTKDLEAFSIMSREGAHSGEKNAEGKFIYDNSASLTINNLKVIHLAK